MVFLLTTGAAANDAVSSTNFKAEGLYGSVDGQTARGIGGSASVPVGDDFGLLREILDDQYAERYAQGTLLPCSSSGEVSPRPFDSEACHNPWRSSPARAGKAGLMVPAARSIYPAGEIDAFGSMRLCVLPIREEIG